MLRMSHIKINSYPIRKYEVFLLKTLGAFNVVSYLQFVDFSRKYDFSSTIQFAPVKSAKRKM